MSSMAFQASSSSEEEYEEDEEDDEGEYEEDDEGIDGLDREGRGSRCQSGTWPSHYSRGVAPPVGAKGSPTSQTLSLCASVLYPAAVSVRRVPCTSVLYPTAVSVRRVFVA